MTDIENKPRARVIDGEYMLVGDGLQSMISNMGNPNRDKSASTVYTDTEINDIQLDNGYRFSWIVRKAVDLPAIDCLRKWRTWNGEEDQNTKIKLEEQRLKVQPKIIDAIQKARLKGGAAVFINTGENVEEPLDWTKVKAGGIKALTVFDRTELTALELQNDPMEENYGKPTFYYINAKGGSASQAKIHYSHLAIFVGAKHPDVWHQTGRNFGWGDSIIQQISQACKNADSTSAGIASLVFEANVDVFGIPDFMLNMGNKSYESKVIERLMLSAMGKGISGTLAHDAAETYNRKQINFTNLPDVLQKFLEIVCAAINYPITKFLGEQSKGLGDKGEGDMRNHYDDIATKQTLEIQPAIQILDECLIRSALGNRPDDLDYDWTPLQQLNEVQISEAGEKVANTAAALSRTNFYDPQALEQATTARLVALKAFPMLDKMVAENARDFNADREFETELRNTSIQGTETNDAAPRTLYINRPVKNADAIIAWAKSQGIEKTLNADDLHVTIAYSSAPVDWMALGEAWQGEITIPEGGARLVESFGNNATVLLFKASELEWRHNEVVGIGGSFDFSEYQPHITITYEQTPPIDEIKPYKGEIILGAEEFQEIDLIGKNT